MARWCVCLKVCLLGLCGGSGCIYRMAVSVDLISPECVLSDCVTLCTNVHPCLSVGPLEAVFDFLCLHLFSPCEDSSHVSVPLPHPSLVPAPPTHPTSFFFFSFPSPHQVDPGPREGRPPGLVVLSRAPQPPPSVSRHEPPLPKNQAGVEAAQGGGGQEEVRLLPGMPLTCLPLPLPGWATSLWPFLSPAAWSSV